MITTIKQEKGFGATLMIDLSKYPHIQNNQKLQEILSQRLQDLLGNLESDLINKCTKELGDNKETIRRQIGDKLETNWRQIGDKLETNWRQIGDKLGDKLGDKKIIRMPSNSDCHPLPCLKSLAGNEARIMRYFFDHISQHHKLNLDKIILKDLVEALQIKESSLKKSFCRLTIKQFLIRHPGRRGQRGFLNFEVPLPIFNQMLTLNYTSNTCSTLNQLGDKLGDKSPPVVVVDIKPPTKPSPCEQLLNNDLERHGFRKGHLVQIENLCNQLPVLPTLEEIQESLKQLCYDVDVRFLNIKKTPVTFFIGTLRNKKTLYQTDNPTYKNLDLEQTQETVTSQVALSPEDSAKITAFVTWRNSLKLQQMRELGGFRGCEGYFNQNVWPNLSPMA